MLTNSGKYSDSVLRISYSHPKIFIKYLICVGIILGAWNMEINKTKQNTLLLKSLHLTFLTPLETLAVCGINPVS